MDRVRDNKVFLQMLLKSNAKYRKLLLTGAPPEIMKLLSECALNILRGNIILNQKEKKQLKPYRRNLHKLASKTVSDKVKKKVLQKGGMIPPMMKPILKAMIPVLANQIVKLL